MKVIRAIILMILAILAIGVFFLLQGLLLWGIFTLLTPAIPPLSEFNLFLSIWIGVIFDLGLLMVAAS